MSRQPARTIVWRRRAAAVALVALVFGAYALARPRLVADRHWRRADVALAGEDFEAARAHLALCQRARPDESRFPFAAARAARRQRDYRAAEALLKKAADLGHRRDAVQLEEQLTLVQRAGWKGNDAPLLAALDAGAEDAARVREVLADAYFRDFLLGPALEHADGWVALEPGSPSAWLLRGDIQRRLRNRAAAEESYRRAVDLAPAVVRARVGYADLLLEKGRPADAVEHYREAVRQSPRDRDARVGLVRGLLLLDQAADARDVLPALLADFPGDRAVVGLAGRVELFAGRPAEAERHLRTAAEAATDWTVLNDLQLAFARQGKAAEAQVLQARVDRLRQDFDRLDHLAREVQNTLDPAPRVEMGRILIRNGRAADGVAWLREALRCAPDDRAAHAELAAYYAAAGQPELAADHRRFADRP